MVVCDIIQCNSFTIFAFLLTLPILILPLLNDINVSGIKISFVSKMTLCFIIRKVAKIRNRYNQAPHFTGTKSSP